MKSVLNVNEIYTSIQGEGPRVGVPTAFVRLQGCSLRCRYCDTGYALKKEGGKELTTHQVLDEVRKIGGIRDICLTGGDPLEQGDTEFLITLFVNEGYHVVVETGGHISTKDLIKRHTITSAVCKWDGKDKGSLSLCVDYKLPNSGMNDMMFYDAFVDLRRGDSIKFVVGTYEDFDSAVEFLTSLRNAGVRAEALFSPVWGKCIPSELVDKMLLLGEGLYPLRLSLQIHKVIWPEKKRGV